MFAKGCLEKGCFSNDKSFEIAKKVKPGNSAFE